MSSKRLGAREVALGSGRRVVLERWGSGLVLEGPDGARILVRSEELGAFVSAFLELLAETSDADAPAQHGASSVAHQKEEAPSAYDRWTPETDAELLRLRVEGHGVAHIARALKRQPGAVRSRLRKLLDPGGSLRTAVRPLPDTVREEPAEYRSSDADDGPGI